RANEMMLLGDVIDAQTALAWGLANCVVPKGEVRVVAREMALRLAGGPQQALYACKQALRYALDLPEDEAIRRTLTLSEGLSRTSDFSEGVNAFMTKRPAQFTSRLDLSAFDV